MEQETMNNYVAPKVEVYPVALESNIAALQSPTIPIEMEEWKPDETVTPDTGDIFLPI